MHNYAHKSISKKRATKALFHLVCHDFWLKMIYLHKYLLIWFFHLVFYNFFLLRF